MKILVVVDPLDDNVALHSKLIDWFLYEATLAFNGLIKHVTILCNLCNPQRNRSVRVNVISLTNVIYDYTQM